MSKAKKVQAEINKAISCCEITDLFAERLFEERIDVPEGLHLRCEILSSFTWKLYAIHPLCEFYGETAYWTKFDRIGKERYGRTEDKIKADIAALTAQDLRNYINGAKGTIRSFKNIARLDMTFKFSRAHEIMDSAMRESINLDDAGKPVQPIGFDVVFLRRAEEVGVFQDELEHVFAKEFEAMRQHQNTLMNYSYCQPTPQTRIMSIVRQSFTNLHETELKSVFGTHYRNMNTLYDPVLRKLPPFEGCIWGAKPLATNLILGNWIYKSSATPTMLSRTNIPESVRIGYKGKPANMVVDTPVFGDSQNIIHIAELKNGKTSITMTPETRAFQGSDRKAA